MISDVPLGAFLSGGIDSSTVVGLMSEHTSSHVKTFSIGFTEKIYDETRYARIVANRFGTEHREFRVSEQDILDVVRTVLDHLAQPFGRFVGAALLVSKYAREHVAVALAEMRRRRRSGYRQIPGRVFPLLFTAAFECCSARVYRTIAKSLPETPQCGSASSCGANESFSVQAARRSTCAFDWMNLLSGDQTRTTLTAVPMVAYVS